MTDKTRQDSCSTHIIRYALELGLLWVDGDGRDKVREALDALDILEARLEAIGAGGVSGPLMGRAPKGMVGGLQVYRCKIKSRKQIDREIPRELQGWWADVAAGQKLLLRRAVQSDLDRCTLGGKRSRNPADYMCETHTNGSLVSKVALEYMNPEENVFAAPPTTTAGSGKGE